MSKTATKSVTVTYDLFDLPTAQHKAGLAGLVLQIRHMARPERGLPPEVIPDLVGCTPTSATIRFTEQSTQALFDEVYDSSIEEVAVRSKWPDAKLKRVDEVDAPDPEKPGQMRKSKRYVYDVVQPRGRFLRDHLPDKMDPTKDWHKLWRDMLWAIPRAKPLARTPFNQRAAGEPCAEGAAAWSDLLRHEKARKRNEFAVAEVSSSLWLGAQAINAEGVPFRGRVDQTVLLHFWVLTTLIFVPQRIKNDGESEFVGYTLAIPEVADLELFCEDYPRLLHDLPTDVRGFRPVASVIDLPAQAALEFMEHLAQLAQFKTEKKRTADSVSSVEYLHLVKAGNNVKSMAAGRVAPKPELLEKYEAIVGTRERPSPYRNPLFRAGLLLALLRDLDWHECMGPIFAERPWPFFVRGEKTPRSMPWFAADAAKKFESEIEKHQATEKQRKMSTSNSTDAATRTAPHLPLLIHRLVQNYVNRRTEEKSGKTWEEIKKRVVKDEKTGRERIDIPEDYREAREKIASSIFLEMRSRREQDFVDHFTATFCSIKQYLPEEDFRVVAQALLERDGWEQVKTLTLLALSANS
jgi:CRISPR-associated protein Cmx8